MKNFILFVTILLFVGCGYKPTVTQTKEALQGNVFIEVPIDIHNITNSILIREALIDIFTNKFNMKVVKEKSMAQINVSGRLNSVSETQIESVAGYSKTYRESVSVQVSYSMNGKATKTFSVSDFYDFVVDEDSVVSQSKKDEAINIAIRNALLLIPSKIAVTSMIKNDSK